MLLSTEHSLDKLPSLVSIRSNRSGLLDLLLSGRSEWHLVLKGSSHLMSDLGTLLVYKLSVSSVFLEHLQLLINHNCHVFPTYLPVAKQTKFQQLVLHLICFHSK